MFRDRKPLPFVSMVLSALYFIYVINLGSSTMIGDEIGGDPGGMLLPLVLAIFMFVGFATLFITDKKGKDAPSPMTTSQKRLFGLTALMAALYVLFARSVGYLLTTVTLIHTLTFFYLIGDVQVKNLKHWIVSLLGSIAVLIGLYSIGRKVTRTLLLSARAGSIPAFFGSPSAVVAIVLVLLAALYLGILYGGKKLLKGKLEDEAMNAAWLSGLIAVATTELIYLIFRQLFLVELVRGIIGW
ncbi:MAG: tripartite tricarboxylate transporter TctB family protein [Sphaerochaeta sp.]